MKSKMKGLIIVGFAGILGFAGFYLRTTVYGKYSIFLFTAAAISFIVGVCSLLRKTNPDAVYERNIRDILNTFDSILVKSNTVPELTGRSIIEVLSIDDLVDAQLEIRKPICYLKQTESCSFVLLDDTEAYVFIDKKNEDVVSPVEIEIKNLKYQKQKEKDIDSEMLQNIEKTTIVKLSNKKSYRVSPIRKQQQEEQQEVIQQQEQQVENVEVQQKVEPEVQLDPPTAENYLQNTVKIMMQNDQQQNQEEDIPYMISVVDVEDTSQAAVFASDDGIELL